LGDDFECIESLYHGLQVLRCAKGRYPVVVFPAEPGATIDSFKIAAANPPPAVRLPPLVLTSQERERRAGMWDGATFALTRMALTERGTVAGLSGYVGSYFAMVDSAMRIDREAQHSPSGGASLPIRRAILAQSASPLECLLNGGGVSAAIGGATLVVFMRAGAPHMICAKRSNTVADQPGKYHVVPSFIFQPASATQGETEASLERRVDHNVFREYLEELFSVPEAQLRAPAAVYDHPNMRYLRTLLGEGRAHLQVTGAAFNLMNHRPEICTLLLIRDEDWFTAQSDEATAARHGLAPLKFNAEFDGSVGSAILPMADGRWADIYDPKTITPSGAAAIALGVRCAAERLGLREPDWLR
jgi:hypothetical protein